MLRGVLLSPSSSWLSGSIQSHFLKCFWLIRRRKQRLEEGDRRTPLSIGLYAYALPSVVTHLDIGVPQVLISDIHRWDAISRPPFQGEIRQGHGLIISEENLCMWWLLCAQGLFKQQSDQCLQLLSSKPRVGKVGYRCCVVCLRNMTGKCPAWYSNV